MNHQLIIPENINYDCTGCGKCCGGWAVPMTSEDFNRVASIDWSPYASELKISGQVLRDSVIKVSNDENQVIELKKNSLFRQLKDYEIKDSNYRYAIKVAYDGMCPFLVNNLCLIHSKYESTTKPAICQLFPYSFNETPSGTYLSVSFVSQAVIYNTGQALTNQYDYLMGKYADFKKLFPHNAPNWNSLKLTVGQPLDWQAYLDYESKVVDYLKDSSVGFGQRLINCSKFLTALMLNGKSTTLNKANLKYLDKHLLVNLFKIYFPNAAVVRGEADFNLNRFLYQISWGNLYPGIVFKVAGRNFTLNDINDIEFPETDPDLENLLYRYYFCKIFGKLYFGAGFGQLSLLAGFNHLAILYPLIKINSKIVAKMRGVNKVSFIDLAQSIKIIEKRLGETSVSPNTAAVFELLLASSSRLERILTNI